MDVPKLIIHTPSCAMDGKREEGGGGGRVAKAFVYTGERQSATGAKHLHSSIYHFIGEYHFIDTTITILCIEK